MNTWAKLGLENNTLTGRSPSCHELTTSAHIKFQLTVLAILAGALCVFFPLIYISVYHNPKPNSIRLNVPLLGASSTSWTARFAAYRRWTTGGVGMILEEYRFQPSAIFRVPTFQQLYIIPAGHIHDLQDMPSTSLSATEAIVWYFLGRYTGVDLPLFGRPLWAAVKKLTTNLPHFVPPLYQICQSLSDDLFPRADEWTEIAPWYPVSHLVASTNTRVFIGEKFCNNLDWLEVSRQYSQNIAESAGLLKLVPEVFRPMMALFIPQLYRIRRIERFAREIIGAEVTARQRQRKPDLDQGCVDLPSDMLEMLEEVSPADQKDPEHIVNRVLSLCFAGTHGPSNHTVNVLLDLAAQWDGYAEELREELDTVLSKVDGQVTKAALDKLEKLESFMKESARLEPGSALSFYRKVIKPLQLSSGEIIPASSMISVPAIAAAHSKAIYGGNADQFDGLRFYRQRKKEESLNASPRPSATTNKEYLWTTPSEGFLNFGYGRYACPGRFYAGVQTKLIVACILHKYDLRLLPGEQRPQSLAFGDANIPNPKAKILYRSRRSV